MSDKNNIASVGEVVMSKVHKIKCEVIDFVTSDDGHHEPYYVVRFGNGDRRHLTAEQIAREK